MEEPEIIVSEEYPYLEIQLTVRGHQLQDLAYLDTGFDGYLAIPAQYAQAFGKRDYVSRWTLADGAPAAADGYLGIVRLVGAPQSMLTRVACLGDELIVGRGILDRLRVTFDRGRRIEVEL